MTSNGKMYTTVMEKLRFEPRLDATNITVSVQGDHDIIVLGGKVSSYNEKFIAEQAIKNLAKVRSVANEIEVDLDISHKKSDVELAKGITKALKLSASVPSDRIKSVVKDAVVTLSGEVDWHFQKQAAFHAVQALMGIQSIFNTIVVKSPTKIDADKVKEHITKEFERHARLDADKIEVHVDGNRVILKGKVSNFAEIDEAEDAAWSMEGVERVQNDITIW